MSDGLNPLRTLSLGKAAPIGARVRAASLAATLEVGWATNIMAPEIALAVALISVLPAIVSGLIGMWGVTAGQKIATQSAERRERLQELRDVRKAERDKLYEANVQVLRELRRAKDLMIMADLNRPDGVSKAEWDHAVYRRSEQIQKLLEFAAIDMELNGGDEEIAALARIVAFDLFGYVTAVQLGDKGSCTAKDKLRQDLNQLEASIVPYWQEHRSQLLSDQ